MGREKGYRMGREKGYRMGREKGYRMGREKGDWSKGSEKVALAETSSVEVEDTGPRGTLQ